MKKRKYFRKHWKKILTLIILLIVCLFTFSVYSFRYRSIGSLIGYNIMEDTYIFEALLRISCLNIEMEYLNRNPHHNPWELYVYPHALEMRNTYETLTTYQMKTLLDILLNIRIRPNLENFPLFSRSGTSPCSSISQACPPFTIIFSFIFPDVVASRTIDVMLIQDCVASIHANYIGETDIVSRIGAERSRIHRDSTDVIFKIADIIDSNMFYDILSILGN